MFFSSLVLPFTTSCYGCHQLATDLGLLQHVSTTYPSKPALCSFWGCLPHPEVEFHARLVTFLSSSVLSVTTVYHGSHQLAPDVGVPQQVSSIYPSEPAICIFWGCLTHPEVVEEPPQRDPCRDPGPGTRVPDPEPGSGPRTRIRIPDPGPRIPLSVSTC